MPQSLLAETITFLLMTMGIHAPHAVMLCHSTNCHPSTTVKSPNHTLGKISRRWKGAKCALQNMRKAELRLDIVMISVCLPTPAIPASLNS